MYMNMKEQQKFEYSGKLENYQLYAEKKYVQYEQDTYSQYQNYLYKRALYGLNALTKEEVVTMCSKKKQRINKVYQKAQVIINIHKQKLTTVYSNRLFSELFPNSPVTEFFLNNNDTDPNFKNTMTFKDLNISKDQVITLFINEGILPKNFMNLKADPNQLPRLRSK